MVLREFQLDELNGNYWRWKLSWKRFWEFKREEFKRFAHARLSAVRVQLRVSCFIQCATCVCNEFQVVCWQSDVQWIVCCSQSLDSTLFTCTAVLVHEIKVKLKMHRICSSFQNLTLKLSCFCSKCLLWPSFSLPQACRYTQTVPKETFSYLQYPQ